MKTSAHLSLLLCASALAPFTFAAPASEDAPHAVFSEVINEVEVMTPGTPRGVRARVDGVFSAPDLVRTGRRSRAQLQEADGTIVRVGANAVFSFGKDSRTLNLERGSLLLHSPTGKGGGSIVTNSATASVVGTTIIVTATSNGGFKLLVLEGVA